MQNLVQTNAFGYRTDFLKPKFGAKKRNFASTSYFKLVDFGLLLILGVSKAAAFPNETKKFELAKKLLNDQFRYSEGLRKLGELLAPDRDFENKTLKLVVQYEYAKALWYKEAGGLRRREETANETSNLPNGTGGDAEPADDAEATGNETSDLPDGTGGDAEPADNAEATGDENSDLPDGTGRNGGGEKGTAGNGEGPEDEDDNTPEADDQKDGNPDDANPSEDDGPGADDPASPT
jgi:hypothetical protein